MSSDILVLPFFLFILFVTLTSHVSSYIIYDILFACFYLAIGNVSLMLLINYH